MMAKRNAPGRVCGEIMYQKENVASAAESFERID